MLGPPAGFPAAPETRHLIGSTIMDWDDAYANSAYIPDAEAITAAWPREAEAFRASVNGRLNIPYGSRPRERYDLFLPQGHPRGLFMFIHGGYWMAFDKSSWSHLAAGAVAQGWAAAVPGYDLCPAASISGITAQIGTALAHAAAGIDGPVALAGHSAGGHLAARMVCEKAPLDSSISQRISHVLGISGLYDLRPLRRTAMNETLRLSETEARRESPALLTPLRGTRMTAWVGADERPEFRRQTALLVKNWSPRVAQICHVEAPGRHHFNVIAPLCDPASALTRAALGAAPATPVSDPNPG